MTQREFTELTKNGEMVHLECKLARSAIPASFWETYSSFANTDGGTILLGVKEENHVFTIEGVEDAHKATLKNNYYTKCHSRLLSML